MNIVALNSILDRLRDIATIKISFREGEPYGEGLDRIQDELRETEVDTEFRELGAQLVGEIEEDLKQVSKPEQINIIESYPGGPEIEGGLLEIIGGTIDTAVTCLVNFYYTLLGKAKGFSLAHKNLEEIIHLDKEVRTVEGTSNELGESSGRLLSLALSDPFLSAEMNRLLYVGDPTDNAQRAKAILLDAITNSGITKTQTRYEDQYATIAQYIGDVADATKRHVIDPIQNGFNEAGAVATRFKEKFKELLAKQQAAFEKRFQGS